jgi:hypothetical protein
MLQNAGCLVWNLTASANTRAGGFFSVAAVKA